MSIDEKIKGMVRCSCLTKTPEVSFHKEDCTYRIVNEMEAEIAELKKGLQSIANNSCCDRCQEAALVARATLEKSDG